MLKTTLLSDKKLADGYFFRMSVVCFQFASLASLCQALSCCSQSLCLLQKDFNVLLAMTLTCQR